MPPRLMDVTASIRGKNALVTGGSRGIGRAIVEALVVHGARVAFTYNRGKAEAEALVRAYPEQTSCHRMDQASKESIARCFEEYEARWGALNIFVDNAAVGSASVANYQPESQKQDEAIFTINAVGAFHACQQALDLMRKRPQPSPCKLINIASIGGIAVMPAMRLSDNMSKAAVVYMSKQLAAESTHTKVDVFSICPGATETEMFRMSTLDQMTAEQRQAYVDRSPKARLIAPEEIANLVVFLSSEYSEVLHGAVLDASLGLGVHPGLVTNMAPL